MSMKLELGREPRHVTWPQHTTGQSNKSKVPAGPTGHEDFSTWLGTSRIVAAKSLSTSGNPEPPKRKYEESGSCHLSLGLFLCLKSFLPTDSHFCLSRFDQVLCHLETNECQQGTHYLCHLGDISAASFADSLRSVRAHSRGHAQAHAASPKPL